MPVQCPVKNCRRKAGCHHTESHTETDQCKASTFGDCPTCVDIERLYPNKYRCPLHASCEKQFCAHKIPHSVKGGCTVASESRWITTCPQCVLIETDDCNTTFKVPY